MEKLKKVGANVIGVVLNKFRSEQYNYYSYYSYYGYDDNDDSKTLSSGDTVYWCTYNAKKDRRWNHYGTLELADANHPNHS